MNTRITQLENEEEQYKTDSQLHELHNDGVVAFSFAGTQTSTDIPVREPVLKVVRGKDRWYVENRMLQRGGEKGARKCMRY